MSSMQLPLSVSLRDDATFENYCFGQNRQLQQTLMHIEEQAFVYLWGAPGVGCSHLLQACCHEAAKEGKTAVYLSLRDLAPVGPHVFENLETLDLVCIDDLDLIAKNVENEEALFDCYNRIKEAGSTLLVAASVAPQALGLELPDLRSRLLWGLVFHIEALSDAEKKRALQLRASGRGLHMPEEVAEFLLKRCPRDMQALLKILDQLDYASLAARRKLTVPFAKKILSLG